MRQFTLYGSLIATFALMAGCREAGHQPAAADLAVAPAEAIAARGGNAPAAKNFVSPMDPGQEVREVVSNARGNAVYKLSRDGSTLHYRVIVAGAEDLLQGHIHVGPRGSNGPVVAFLFNFTAAPVTKNGVIAEGTITAADVIARPAIGFDGSFESLLREMRRGNTYTNVHTVEFPAGEVRGQIRAVGPPHRH
ncbi:hypothetical protein BH23GEM3_BH23GEM3_21410 [soil metagenome]